MATLVEQAEELYKPKSVMNMDISSDDAVPTLSTDGVDITGYQVGGFSISNLTGITGYDYEIYVWQGNYWKIRSFASGLTDVFDTQSHLATYYRAYLRVFNIVGVGTLNKALNISF